MPGDGPPASERNKHSVALDVRRPLRGRNGQTLWRSAGADGGCDAACSSSGRRGRRSGGERSDRPVRAMCRTARCRCARGRGDVPDGWVQRPPGDVPGRSSTARQRVVVRWPSRPPPQRGAATAASRTKGCRIWLRGSTPCWVAANTPASTRLDTTASTAPNTEPLREPSIPTASTAVCRRAL